MQPSPALPATPLIRVRRRILACRLGGLAAGVLAAVLLASRPEEWLGLGLALAAPAFALCLLAGVIVGEVSGGRGGGPVRTAALEVRSPTRFLPRAATVTVAVLAGVLLALLAITTAVADADDQGRAGRVLTVACGIDARQSSGPFPGWFYSAPIGAAVLVGLALAGLAAYTVARRRRPLPGADGRAGDDAVRRSSARAIVAATGVLVAAPLTGVALATGGVLARSSCAPAPVPALGTAALVLAALAALATCAFTAMAVAVDAVPTR